MDTDARLFNCARCHRQVVICSRCDRGNLYCGSQCAQSARGESVRAPTSVTRAARAGALATRPASGANASAKNKK
jgi:hypothetical protein